MRDRRERFVALAEARTGRVLNAMRLLGNLSDRSNYEYTEADVVQITRALETELKLVKSRFADASAGRERSFRLERRGQANAPTETQKEFT